MSIAPIKVSVVIAACNAALTLRETLKSLLAQTYMDWEAIVVDDGSTDGTLIVAESFAKIDNRIRLTSQANMGVSNARNHGIAMATGDWLLFLDSDDTLSNQHLQVLTQELANDVDLDAIVCGWRQVFLDGTSGPDSIPRVETDLFPALTQSCVFAIHCCVVRKSLVLEVGGFDEKISVCEDWDLWQRIARSGARFRGVNQVLSYYHYRNDSISKQGNAFFSAGQEVLRRGYSADERVPHPVKKYKLGLNYEKFAEKEYYWVSWCAGMLIAQRKAADELLHLMQHTDVAPLDAHTIARNIFDAVCFANGIRPSDFISSWKVCEQSLLDFLASLETKTKNKGLAKTVVSMLRRMAVEPLTYIDKSIVANACFQTIEVSEAISDLQFPVHVEEFFCILHIGQKKLGHVELPVFDGRITAYVLTDAIAEKFSWKILGCFFKNVAFAELTAMASTISDQQSEEFDALHDRFGWSLFTQQLWGKESIPVQTIIIKGKANALTLEISEDLPRIKTINEVFVITLTVRGVRVGNIQVQAEDNVVSSNRLKETIENSFGYELCRICVREALIGRSLHDNATLRQRLQVNKLSSLQSRGWFQKARHRFLNAKNELLRIGSLQFKKRTGLQGSSVSRRAALPASTAPLLVQMAVVANEKFQSFTSHPKDVFYRPELLSETELSNQPMDEAANSVAMPHQYDRHHFETLFAKSADPWLYTHAYEQTKYEQTLSLLQSLRVERCLELACAEGHFTQQLAPLVKQLVAADISKVALERAANRCAGLSNIVYQQLDINEDPIEGSYDLIVCSEVLYYMGGIDELKLVAKKISHAVVPGGHLLMAHAHQVVDEPNQAGFDWGLAYGAKTISDIFSALPNLKLKKEIRTPLYRIQLFQQGSGLSSTPEILIMEQPTSIPFAVESTVRWNGGAPKIMNETIVTRQLPILMYHRVAPQGAQKMNRYRITPEQFEEQLSYLRDNGYYGIDLNKWLRAMMTRQPLPGRAIALTFDDGYKDFYEFAWPLLNKYKFSATVFLVADLLGKTNSWDKEFGEELPLMNEEEIAFLQQNGIGFGSHTATHRALGSLSPTQVVEEVVRARTILHGKLDVPVRSIAYPYGSTNGVVSHICGGVGYQIGLTVQPGLSRLQDDPLLLPRIEVVGNEELKNFVAKLV